MHYMRQKVNDKTVYTFLVPLCVDEARNSISQKEFICMEIIGTPYEKSEMLVIAEQIYETKGKIQDLTLSLEDEKFHAKYIPRRKELAYTQSASGMFYIILLSFIVIICLISFIVSARMGPDLGNSGIFLIAVGGIVIFGGYADYKLIRQQIEIFPLLHYNFREEKALRYSGKKQITTYQSDEIQSKKKIALLEEEINQLSEKLENLENTQQELLRKKEEKEQFLKDKGILVEPEEAGERGFAKGSLSLKQRDDFSDNVQELFELYDNEEKYIKGYIDRLSFRLEEINREIIKIEDNYEVAKKKIIIGMLCFIILIGLQSVFSDILGKISVLIACMISIAGIFYLDKVCSPPILLYLVEQESKWTNEYAFINDLIPVRYKRDELLEVLENNKRELRQVQDKKAALD